MTTKLLAALSVFATMGSVVAATRQVGTSSGCLGPDNYSATLTNSLKEAATSNAPWAVALRANTHLPQIGDSAVMVVSDSTKCAAATIAYNDEVRSAGATVSDVYLFRVGSAFVASNPSNTNGREFTENLVMDSTFTAIGVIVR